MDTGIWNGYVCIDNGDTNDGDAPKEKIWTGQAPLY